MILVNEAHFFDVVRDNLGKLSQSQVDGFHSLLTNMAGDPVLVDSRQAAYMLATTWHETGTDMLPVREDGRGRKRRYGKPGRNRGQVPYGRGYVQLTWDANYEKADRELGLKGALIADYDLALDPTVAYQIMSRGMIEGWFTGRKLSQYILGKKKDYINARQIINGLDRAALVASYAKHFENALRLP